MKNHYPLRTSGCREFLPCSRLGVGLLAATLAGSGAVSAQEKSSVSPASPQVAALSLEECRRLALSNNLMLRAQREALAAAGFLKAAELGAFEPEFVGSSSQEHNKRENTIEQTISQGTSLFEEDNKLFSAGLEGLVPTGARYRIGWSERDITNNLRLRPTDPFRNEFQAFLGVTVTQPLLKDFGLSATMARARLAREDEKIARQDFRRQMMLVVGAVETAYWDLYVAQERRRLRLESMGAADKLLGENKERVREGKMAEIELIEAQAGLAQRRSYASEAAQRQFDAIARLKTLVAEPVNATNWLIRAADPLPTPTPMGALDDALSSAMSLHPEYLARLHKAEQENVRVAYARNQRWPQVDLKASYGRNGLGTGLNNAWGDIEHRDFDSWSVGVEVRVPILLGVRRRNELKASQSKRREALLNLKAAEIEIANNLQGARRKVESLLEVAANYEEVATAGQRLLENERTRLGEGKSDSRRLLEIENQYADAAIAALESRGEYEKARIEFELSSGRLLQARGVDLEADKIPKTLVSE